jgi:hypothetical protein
VITQDGNAETYSTFRMYGEWSITLRTGPKLINHSLTGLTVSCLYSLFSASATLHVERVYDQSPLSEAPWSSHCSIWTRRGGKKLAARSYRIGVAPGLEAARSASVLWV